jgi:hypothetical protein
LRGFGGRRPQGLGTARRSSRVLRDPLRAVREVLRRLPRVLTGSQVVPLPGPPHQVVSPAPEGLAVEKLLHHILALLALVGEWAGRVWFVLAGMVGLETLHVDRRAAPEAAWEGQGVGIRACQGDDPKETLPPRSQLADLRRVEQLSRPEQHLVAANLEGRGHPTAVERPLALLLGRVQQRLHLLFQGLYADPVG